MDRQFNWAKVLTATAIGFVMIIAFRFWQAKNDPLNSIDMDLALQDCIVKFSPNGEMDVIPFGDPRCPK